MLLSAVVRLRALNVTTASRWRCSAAKPDECAADIRDAENSRVCAADTACQVSPREYLATFRGRHLPCQRLLRNLGRILRHDLNRK